MRIFCGLGNPGAKYAANRHNIGFMALDHIAQDHSFSPWRARFQGLVSEGLLAGEKVVLLKPQTFMNLSGQSVGEALRFYKLQPDDLTVFHDELDLPPGKLRLKQGGGHAGHNGLRSIHGHIGETYGRVRMGIGHPGHKDAVAAFVLHDFAKLDAKWLDQLLAALSQSAAHLAKGDGGRFQTAVALLMAPPKPPPKPPSAPKAPKTLTVSAPPAAVADLPAAQAAPDLTGADDTRSVLQKLRDRFRADG